jgi:RNA polymerase sigma-B factor
VGLAEQITDTIEDERLHGPSDEWLLKRWPRRGDVAARDQLIARLLPLARRVARSYGHDRHVDDLMQAASLGLFKAVDRYDPARGSSLNAYAMPMMAGEVRRWLRDHAWAVRPPRGLQERTLTVRRAANDLEQRLGRRPSVQEVAEAAGMSLPDVVEAQVAGRALSAVSLEAGGQDDEDGHALSETLGEPDGDLQRVPERATLAAAIAQLPPRDRTILRLRFEEDLTQVAIGERLGMSQMTVSRALRRLVPRLRELHLDPDAAA